MKGFVLFKDEKRVCLYFSEKDLTVEEEELHLESAPTILGGKLDLRRV